MCWRDAPTKKLKWSAHSDLTVLDVLLPVEEPVGDLVLARVLHNGDDFLNLLLAELACALRQVDVGLLEDDVGVSAADSLNGGHREHDVPLAVDVCVHHTENVLEIGWEHDGHLGCRVGDLPQCKLQSEQNF